MVRSAVTPAPGAAPGAYSAAMVSPSTRTSIGVTPVVDTTDPPVMSVVLMPQRRSLGHEVVVGVRPAVPVELPAVADGLHEVHVEVPHDELGLVAVGRLADELALRIDEVGRAVEVVVAERLDAHAVD